MNGLDIMLLLKSGAKLRLFFELCKCLSDNFLNYFLRRLVGLGKLVESNVLW